MKIRIGSEIRCIIGNESYISKVRGIEICKDGEKYGRNVTKCDTSKHNNGIVDLDEHWCYFHQIKQVINY